MALFGRAFSLFDMSLTTEHEGVAQLYSSLLGEICGAETSWEKSRSGKITVSVKSAEDKKKVLAAFGHGERELSRRINRANIENECCAGAFLRGAFLSCGTVTDPGKDYHAEFSVSHMKLCGDLSAFMAEAVAEPKSVERKGSMVLYVKESTLVEDLITYMGAINSSLEIMAVKMYKDMRNNVNRKTNFETANISRTVKASVSQIEAIELIKAKRGLASLPPELAELAELRYENPEMSLRELGESLSEPISRSGVNHRLERIIRIAADIASTGGKGNE